MVFVFAKKYTPEEIKAYMELKKVKLAKQKLQERKLQEEMRRHRFEQLRLAEELHKKGAVAYRRMIERKKRSRTSVDSGPKPESNGIRLEYSALESEADFPHQKVLLTDAETDSAPSSVRDDVIEVSSSSMHDRDSQFNEQERLAKQIRKMKESAERLVVRVSKFTQDKAGKNSRPNRPPDATGENAIQQKIVAQHQAAIPQQVAISQQAAIPQQTIRETTPTKALEIPELEQIALPIDTPAETAVDINKIVACDAVQFSPIKPAVCGAIFDQVKVGTRRSEDVDSVHISDADDCPSIQSEGVSNSAMLSSDKSESDEIDKERHDKMNWNIFGRPVPQYRPNPLSIVNIFADRYREGKEKIVLAGEPDSSPFLFPKPPPSFIGTFTRSPKLRILSVSTQPGSAPAQHCAEPTNAANSNELRSGLQAQTENIVYDDLVLVENLPQPDYTLPDDNTFESASIDEHEPSSDCSTLISFSSDDKTEGTEEITQDPQLSPRSLALEARAELRHFEEMNKAAVELCELECSYAAQPLRNASFQSQLQDQTNFVNADSAVQRGVSEEALHDTTDHRSAYVARPNSAADSATEAKPEIVPFAKQQVRAVDVNAASDVVVLHASGSRADLAGFVTPASNHGDTHLNSKRDLGEAAASEVSVISSYYLESDTLSMHANEIQLEPNRADGIEHRAETGSDANSSEIASDSEAQTVKIVHDDLGKPNFQGDEILDTDYTPSDDRVFESESVHERDRLSEKSTINSYSSEYSEGSEDVIQDHQSSLLSLALEPKLTHIKESIKSEVESLELECSYQSESSLTNQQDSDPCQPTDDQPVRPVPEKDTSGSRFFNIAKTVDPPNIFHTEQADRAVLVGLDSEASRSQDLAYYVTQNVSPSDLSAGAGLPTISSYVKTEPVDSNQTVPLSESARPDLVHNHTAPGIAAIPSKISCDSKAPDCEVVHDCLSKPGNANQEEDFPESDYTPAEDSIVDLSELELPSGKTSVISYTSDYSEGGEDVIQHQEPKTMLTDFEKTNKKEDVEFCESECDYKFEFSDASQSVRSFTEDQEQNLVNFRIDDPDTRVLSEELPDDSADSFSPSTAKFERNTCPDVGIIPIAIGRQDISDSEQSNEAGGECTAFAVSVTQAILNDLVSELSHHVVENSQPKSDQVEDTAATTMVTTSIALSSYLKEDLLDSNLADIPRDLDRAYEIADTLMVDLIKELRQSEPIVSKPGSNHTQQVSIPASAEDRNLDESHSRVETGSVSFASSNNQVDQIGDAILNDIVIDLQHSEDERHSQYLTESSTYNNDSKNQSEQINSAALSDFPAHLHHSVDQNQLRAQNTSASLEISYSYNQAEQISDAILIDLVTDMQHSEDERQSQYLTAFSTHNGSYSKITSAALSDAPAKLHHSASLEFISYNQVEQISDTILTDLVTDLQQSEDERQHNSNDSKIRSEQITSAALSDFPAKLHHSVDKNQFRAQNASASLEISHLYNQVEQISDAILSDLVANLQISVDETQSQVQSPFVVNNPDSPIEPISDAIFPDYQYLVNENQNQFETASTTADTNSPVEQISDAILTDLITDLQHSVNKNKYLVSPVTELFDVNSPDCAKRYMAFVLASYQSIDWRNPILEEHLFDLIENQMEPSDPVTSSFRRFIFDMLQSVIISLRPLAHDSSPEFWHRMKSRKLRDHFWQKPAADDIIAEVSRRLYPDRATTYDNVDEIVNNQVRKEPWYYDDYIAEVQLEIADLIFSELLHDSVHAMV